MLHIIFVKKILPNGELCKKCREVSERLGTDGLTHLIDSIVIADERDAQSPGIQLARLHNMQRAPFFLIKDEAGKVSAYDVYFRFKKFLIDRGLSQAANAVDL
jgi:hypothetical protein